MLLDVLSVTVVFGSTSFLSLYKFPNTIYSTPLAIVNVVLALNLSCLPPTTVN
jgi:hypothetical protein